MVDKMYLQRKELRIRTKDWADNEDTKEEGLRAALINSIIPIMKKNPSIIKEANSIVDKMRGKLSSKERKALIDKIKAETETYEEEEHRLRWLDTSREMTPEEKEKALDKTIDKLARTYSKKYIEDYLNGLGKRITETKIKHKGEDRFRDYVDNIYRRIAYKTEAATEGRVYRNNKIIDMTYEVLTHESQADKILTPQGFDKPKKLGYAVQAYKMGMGSWKSLMNKSISELKDMITANKNLIWIDTQIQYYKQNAAAGTILGMFAVQKVAHSALEGDEIRMDISKFFDEGESPSITIGNYTIDSSTVIDNSTNILGDFIGRDLGALVGASADAAKDPILNLMNINSNTAGVLTTMMRMGIPFETAAMLISSGVISEMLDRYSRDNLTNGYASLSNIVKTELKEIEDEIGESRQLREEGISEKEILRSINTPYDMLDDSIKYKILNAYDKLSSIANAMRSLTLLTRFNSISSAVGPLIIDNLIMEHNLNNFSDNFYIIDENGERVDIGYKDVLAMHPILEGFHQTLGVADELFQGMPANSYSFRSLLDLIESEGYSNMGNRIFGDRATLSKLSDFFQSYALIASGVVDANKLNYYINDFPSEFLALNPYEKFSNNPFIQNMKLRTNKKEHTFLNVDISGLDQMEKDKLSNGWSDLYKAGAEGRKLATDFFFYPFFRRGIGFSPESSMSLFPLTLKEKFNGYKETYKRLPFMDYKLVIDQFVRNNPNNNRLFPTLEYADFKDQGFKTYKDKITSYEDDTTLRYKNTPYIRVKFGKDSFKYYKNMNLKTGAGFVEISTLGNNGEYLEMSLNDIKTPLFDPNKIIKESAEAPKATGREALEEQQIDTPEEEGYKGQEETKDSKKVEAKERLMKLWENAENPWQTVLNWSKGIKDPTTKESKTKLLSNFLKKHKGFTEQQIKQTLDDLNMCG